LKPLFNPRLLAEARREHPFILDDEQRRIAAAWATGAANGTLLGQKERPLQGQFLSEFFDRLLGYRQIVGAEETHHMEPETSSTAVKGYRPPDARLGWFGPAIDRTRGVLELKGPGADLDAKQGAGYGKLTPVEQAFGYAAKVDGCRWVIVSNFVEVRLYRTDRGQGYCQRLKVADLADPDALETWVFLLSRVTLLGSDPADESPVERLVHQTHVEEERITKAFYCFYRDLRLDLFHQLKADNPAPNEDQAVDHQVRLLELAQKLLDRCLFICFCEDTRLLPAKVLRRALTVKTEGFVPVSRWQQLCGLFAAVDRGYAPMQINGYNGGLFALDPALDRLCVADASLNGIEALAGYDYETDLNVNILGHIFEQSITDLEAIRAAIRGEAAAREGSRRKRDGIFYTPEFITRFMTARTIGGWLAERYALLETRYRSGKPGPMSTETRLRIWVDYLEVLQHIKVLDPACGSGAFLVAAFDYLSGEYERVNRGIAELSGAPRQLGLFDLDRRILQENLFGVDLNNESVEITKLSLWLKTARRDRPLNTLDGNIRCGNSLVEPPATGVPSSLTEAYVTLPADARAFDWRAAFPGVFAQGGFDVIVGNPPYVRQELLGPFKPYLAQRYASYHGVADLYVYFYERGLELLAPGGKLSYIVTNKWLRAGYGEPLRRFFTERAEVDEILDFGHAPIFEDADTFPCIIVAHPRPVAPAAADSPPLVRVCPVPRDRSSALSLDNYVHEHGYPVPWGRYGAAPWSLESPEVDDLMGKVRGRGVPLAQFVGVKPYRGVLTGLNEAFLIDDATRATLIREDPGCADVIKPYLRGQDIKRWVPDWQGLWMIFARRGIDIDAYPSIRAHLNGYRSRLESKPSDWDQLASGDWPGRKPGRYAWYEIQDSVDYWQRMDEPKIVHTDIAWRPQFAFSDTPLYFVNTCYFWPTTDLFALAVMNSPLMWGYLWRHAQHGKDEALRLFNSFTTTLPIAEPTPQLRTEAEERVASLLALSQGSQDQARELLNWLRLELGVTQPGQRLAAFADLTGDDFVAEVRKRRPKGAPRLTPKAITELIATHRHYADPERARAAQVRTLERRLSDLVNQAYRLTTDEIDLLWRTAPPRMPQF
jgi:hypothetical protein